MRHTKIVATIGPAVSSPERIRELIDAGIDVARLNFSHDTHSSHARHMGMVRDAAREANRPVAILADLQGPKIRTGPLPNDAAVTLVDGQTLTITARDAPGTPQLVGTTYRDLARDVRAGDRLLVSDGLIELRVENVDGDDVVTHIVHGGSLRPHQGINLPGVAVTAPTLTDKDRDDLRFALSQGVDYIALSFVRSAQDVRLLKQEIAAAGHRTPVIAKLEKPEAVEHLDEILAESDGIMVARGDMGVECSPEQVPVIQKRVIRCLQPSRQTCDHRHANARLDDPPTATHAS